MTSFWRIAILATAALAVAAAGAGLAAAADSGVHIWINGKEVKPGDPIDLGAGGGGSIRIETRSSRVGGADVVPDAVPGAPGEAYLGVIANPLEGKAREEIESHKGVLVGSVLRGSPAAKAGIEAGDVIAEIGGKTIEMPQELVDRVREQKPGTETKVVFYREGKRMEKTVALGVRPGSAADVLPAPKAAGAEVFMGLALAPVTKEIAELSGAKSGALVSSLPDESPAAKAGLQPGDVIVSIGGKEVGSPDDLIRLIGEHKPGDVVTVIYFRMGKKGSVDVNLGARPAGRGQPDMGIPDDILRGMPELRQFLDEMRKGLDNRAGRPNLVIPPAPAEPYGMGKDIGKILERLDKIEKRLDQMEKNK